ncbi:MerR family transcriptional regulator [Allostreptomyces psammosilenae]|uniref:DNA-binding transcriptional MerR regulator n=1 Tax=Allostreptomyces psammosilenae TaxID=1892865 RepID=A0A852ZY46_9ACTN|nr:MerR family transcriptional regulator [Allostreptomyces psammosilenae]NYI05644.1 DNA-binding transcriptional MerR regulator [Allostreptomyces psammosilenae]
MRIGELSRRTGVSERALRYYEEQGLLRPARRPSGYREYDEADVARVRRIRLLLAAGLGTAVIAEVLPCMWDAGELLAPACDELTDDLARERDRITEAIEELAEARALLEAIMAAPRPEDAAELAAVGACAAEPGPVGARAPEPASVAAPAPAGSGER